MLKHIVEWIVNHFAICRENRSESTRFHQVCRRIKAAACIWNAAAQVNYPLDVLCFLFPGKVSKMFDVIFVVLLGSL